MSLLCLNLLNTISWNLEYTQHFLPWFCFLCSLYTNPIKITSVFRIFPFVPLAMLLSLPGMPSLHPIFYVINSLLSCCIISSERPSLTTLTESFSSYTFFYNIQFIPTWHFFKICKFLLLCCNYWVKIFLSH